MNDILLGAGALVVWLVLTLDAHLHYPHVLGDDE